MSRVRLLKEDRKKQILDASIEIFTEKGFKKTTMSGICKRVGISKGGLYHYYPNKESIFRELIEEGLEKRKTAIKEYIIKNKDLPREDLLVNLLLEKIVDENKYKSLFVTFMVEANSNPNFKNLYCQWNEYATKDFTNFCKKENLEEYIQLTTKEYGAFIGSLILGFDILKGNYDKDKLRKMIKDIIVSYFKYLEIL